ncbi:MAG: alpha/beta hydrolase [Alphaproteobacteria bacterium]|nr:alpha/beta hydrolase [Alphaproteobacteria bacterium]
MIIVFRVLGIAAAFYLVVLALVYIFQRQMLYFPDKRALPALAKDNALGMETVETKTADGLKLKAWFAPPRDKDGEIIVMYHGNAGNAADRAGKAKVFIDQGYGVYLCEYRGYGGNPGSPTERGLYADGRSALAWLEDHGYSPSHFIIYGESLGTGVAVQMALEMQPKLLVLEAPFSSAVEVGQAHYPFLPVDTLMKDRYDSIAKIGKVKSSLLIVHGDEDAVIPIALSHRLFEAANHTKEFSSVHEGTHVDLYERHAGNIVLDWLKAQLKLMKPKDDEAAQAQGKKARTGGGAK